MPRAVRVHTVTVPRGVLPIPSLYLRLRASARFLYTPRQYYTHGQNDSARVLLITLRYDLLDCLESEFFSRGNDLF